MSNLFSSVVFLLMLSIGMSLKPTEVLAHWRRLDWLHWLVLLVVTFVVPAALALLLANLFRLTLGETAGLFLLGAAPGAPLLVRNVSRKGFDAHLAAIYQVSVALMIPVMVPVIVAAAGKLYERDIWIPPGLLLRQIAIKQLLPLIIGIAFASLAPRIATRYRSALNLLGSILLLVAIALILYKVGPSLKFLTPLVPVAALLLALGSMAAMLFFPSDDTARKQTLVICNANRHAGLALLLASQFVRAPNALPVIVCYALLAPLVMSVYVKAIRHRTKVPSEKQIAAGTAARN